MQRDIDEIIRRVALQFPDARVEQLKTTHPADDDGIWWFSLPPSRVDIHVESSRGNCPFFIETDEQSSFAALHTHTVEQTVDLIAAWLTALSEGRSIRFRQEDYPK